MKYSVFYFLLLLVIPFALHSQTFLDSEELKFRNLGPERGGRCTTVEGVAKETGTFYAGYTGGGVWKTTDYGQTWKNISDGFFSSPSIGSIEVFQKDPKIIYVGTGTDGLRSNVIPGRGVYKSMDAGKNWTFIGLKESAQIGAVETHPDDSNIVFVAAIGSAFGPNEDRGIFRSKDGGKSWEKVLYISDQTGFADIEFHPTNPDILYAAAWHAERKPWTIISGSDENGIYKSTDGGNTWKKMDQGLPKFKGKIDLAVSPADPDRLMALVEAKRKEDGLYRSDDAGETFVQVSDKMQLLNRPFYYTNLYADPSNADRIFSFATRAFQSNDGGKTWKPFSARHGDHHDMWIHPDYPNLMVQSNDGGANVSHNGGKTWSSQFNQPTSEIYQIEVDNQYPYWVYGGQQDNYSTIAVPSLPPFSVQAGHTAYITNTGGCETGPAVPHPENPNIVYSNCKGKFSRFNKLTGQEQQYNVGAYYMYGHDPKDLPYRFQRVSPIHISPHDPSVIYHCSQFVHKTTDEGKTWETISPDLTAFTPETQGVSGSPITRDITGEEFYSTIYALQESKREKGVIWVGANDGPIHVTQDGGKNWIDVTPKDLQAGGRVDAVEASVHANGKAYACILRYQLGDPKPYIYRTKNYGKSWELIVKGIPSDYPIRVLREDPEVEGLLYAGTEYGLFISTDDGDHWQTFQKNLPIVPITDLKVHRGDLVMSTMGRGFWSFDGLSSLRQSMSGSTASQLMKPSDTYAYLYSTRRASDAIYNHISYPSPGVTIDYFLKDSLSSPLFVEIMDVEGKVIRKYRSKLGQKDSVLVKEDMNLSYTDYKESKALMTNAGGHRFKWDLRHGNRVIAKPGTYTARLFCKDFDFSESFEVLADPRISESDMQLKDYEDQESFSIEVADLLKEAEDYVKGLEKKKKNLDKMESKSAAQERKIEELKSQIAKFRNNKEIHYPQQMFLAQIRYLMGISNRTYQQVNKDSKDRLQQLKSEFKSLKQGFNQEIGLKE